MNLLLLKSADAGAYERDDPLVADCYLHDFVGCNVADEVSMDYPVAIIVERFQLCEQIRADDSFARGAAKDLALGEHGAWVVAEQFVVNVWCTAAQLIVEDEADTEAAVDQRSADNYDLDA
ncbi:MAG: hypothetical protein IT348_05035 [Candidatus Eisenbacteria bacterium]|nr:hypothetical protein [Candidatus Eisenbacteria bacterium]